MVRQHRASMYRTHTLLVPATQRHAILSCCLANMQRDGVVGNVSRMGLMLANGVPCHSFALPQSPARAFLLVVCPVNPELLSERLHFFLSRCVGHLDMQRFCRTVPLDNSISALPAHTAVLQHSKEYSTRSCCVGLSHLGGS